MCVFSTFSYVFVYLVFLSDFVRFEAFRVRTYLKCMYISVSTFGIPVCMYEILHWGVRVEDPL